MGRRALYRECEKCGEPKRLGFGGIPVWTCYRCLREPCRKCDSPNRTWCNCCLFCGQVHSIYECPNPTMGMLRFDFSGGGGLFGAKIYIDPESEQN